MAKKVEANSADALPVEDWDEAVEFPERYGRTVDQHQGFAGCRSLNAVVAFPGAQLNEVVGIG
jgi:hypothetical protein